MDKQLFLASLGVLVALLLLGSTFIVTCVVAGFLVFFAFWLLVKKSRAVHWLVVRFPVLTDAAVTIGSFFLFSGMGITAVLASAVTGILTTGYVAHERMRWLEEITTSEGRAGAGGVAPRAKPGVQT